jgi:hypothetical protein
MDFICVGIRIPKCGSTSLSRILNLAFSHRKLFHLPHTLNLEGALSVAQAVRFRRSQAQNLFRHYRTFDIAKACARIDRWALDGDLILGGHIDFPFVRDHIARPVKMITLFREPGARCRSEYDYCRARYREKSVLSRLDATIKHRMAARYSFDAYLDFLLEHANSYGNLASRYVGWDGRESLDRFFERSVFHSGVLEQSETFARTLAAKMNVPLWFPHENRTKAATTALNAAQRAKIEQLYPRDFQLYEWQLATLERDRMEKPAITIQGPEATFAITLADEKCGLLSPEEWTAPPVWERHVSRTGSA